MRCSDSVNSLLTCRPLNSTLLCSDAVDIIGKWCLLTAVNDADLLIRSLLIQLVFLIVLDVAVLARHISRHDLGKRILSFLRRLQGLVVGLDRLEGVDLLMDWV